MLAFLQYLIALLISLSDPAGGTAAPRVTEIVVVMSACGVLYATLAIVLAVVIRRSPSDGLGKFLFVQNALRVISLGAFWVIAQPLGGHALPRALGIEGWFFVPHLVRLAPYFVLLALASTATHSVASALSVSPPGRLQAAIHNVKQALIALLPLGLLVVYDLLAFWQTSAPGSLVGRILQIVQRIPLAQVALSISLLFAAMLAMPFVLRLAWRAQPLPAGPLRTRLEAYSRRIGLRARDILVWPSGGDLVNAMVVGVLPRFRYVVLTDGLIETLSEDEVEAVFAHEAGHACRGHMLLFIGFTSVVALASLLPGGLPSGLAQVFAQVPPGLRAVLAVLLWLGVVLGFVSRRFEQEADVFGIETLPAESAGVAPELHPFTRALERIAAEIGGIREMTGWRHFSVADRVDFVRQYLTDERVRKRYRRNITLLRGSLIAVIGGFTLLALASVPKAWEDGMLFWRAQVQQNAILPLLSRSRLSPNPLERAAYLQAASVLAEREGRHDEALRWLRESVALSPGNASALRRYAEALERTGQVRGALLAWRELEALEAAGEADRAAAGERATSLEAQIAER